MSVAIGVSNIDERLAELRSIVDAADELNAQLKDLNERKGEIERGLLSFSEDSGLTSFATEGLSITIREKVRARYDPEKWDDIMRWAAANDKTYVIQRRLSDAKIADMVESGEALPDGLSVEPYSLVTYRRK